ncbi:MAG: alpha/beta hydrolase, partial [Intrasporangiaceae bacterium]|nr:alpha/beta hydrolase [Intrasporangiaceae bacterium]
MTHRSGTFTSTHDGLSLASYTWGADLESPRGLVQVAHGLAEHSARYARVAEALTDAGYVVAAIDHRGHGASITDTPGDFGAPGWDGLLGDLVDFGA